MLLFGIEALQVVALLSLRVELAASCSASRDRASETPAVWIRNELEDELN